MMNSKLVFIMVLLFLSNTIVFSQSEFQKHQISINASKFVLIFNEQVNNLDLTYRLAVIDSTLFLRGATSIDLATGEDDLNDFSVRLGVDKVFKVTQKWRFYYGIDANYGRTIANSTDRTTTKVGLIPFIGFLFQLGPHFSLSSEPSLAIFRNEVIDNNSFNPNANSTDVSFNLINIGQIKVGFHF